VDPKVEAQNEGVLEAPKAGVQDAPNGVLKVPNADVLDEPNIPPP